MYNLTATTGVAVADQLDNGRAELVSIMSKIFQKYYSYVLEKIFPYKLIGSQLNLLTEGILLKFLC